MYDMGYHRVGCIGCPLATYKQKQKEFSDFPKYKELYIKAFDRMLEVNRKTDPTKYGNWKDGKDVYDWWVEEYRHTTKGQMNITDYMNEQTDEWGLIVRKPSEGVNK